MKVDVALIGFDLDIIDLIETHPEYKFCGYVDKDDMSPKFKLEFPRLGCDQDWESIRKEHPSWKVALGVDIPEVRKKVYAFYDDVSQIVTLQSPLAHISERATVGNGTVIQHGCTVMPYAVIGRGCSLNVNATMHHESELGDFSILAPGALILGRVKIGEETYIGAAAVIRQGCEIGDRVTIGAGAVVVDNIPSNSKVVGVPANRFL